MESTEPQEQQEKTPMELVARKSKLSFDQIKDTISLIDLMAIGIQMQYEPIYHDSEELMKTLALSKMVLVPRQVPPTVEKIKSPFSIPGFAFAAFSNQRVYLAVSVDMHSLPDKMGCLKIEAPTAVDVSDNEFVGMFANFGAIYEFRVVLDPKSKQANGNYYLTYMNEESAPLAVEGLNGFLIGCGEELSVRQVSPRKRLFIGNIPKSKGLQDLEKSFHVLTSSLLKVITFPAETDEHRNRGFCFLEYATHGAAVTARRRLAGMKVFGCDLLVDWAEKDREEDGSLIKDNTTIHVRPMHESVSDDAILIVFGQYGKIEVIRRMRGYAFVHYKERDSAAAAVACLSGCEIFGEIVKVAWAKPKSECNEVCHIYERRTDRLCELLLKKLKMEMRDGGDELANEIPKASVYALVNNKNVKKRVNKSRSRLVTDHSSPKSARKSSPL